MRLENSSIASANSTQNKFSNSIQVKVNAMAKVNIRPLDDRVVIQPMEAEQTTAGGIVLPDSAKEKPQRGKVVAVGPGKLLDNGVRATLSIAVGDEVIFGKYGGSEIEVDGVDYKILRESDVLAKLA
jgi:chaperonin GroES